MVLIISNTQLHLMTLRSPRMLLLVSKCLEVSWRERLGPAVFLAGEGGAGLLLSVVREELSFVFRIDTNPIYVSRQRTCFSGKPKAVKVRQL